MVAFIRKYISVLLLIMLFTESMAQDIQFSMFYSVPLYLSPALAGSRHANRALLHQRWQWPSLEASFTTTQFSFDTYSQKYNSGFGLMVLQDEQGRNYITSTQLAAQYSYELRLSSRYTIRAGLQGGFIQQRINIENLPSDYTDEGRKPAGLATSPYSFSKLFPDISSGAIFYDRNLWISLATHHLNRPNQAIVPNRKDLLYTKLTLTAGYKIPISLGGSTSGRGLHGAPDLIFLTPTMTYKHQGPNDQLDIGLYFTRRWFISGIWYRGIPFKRYDFNIPNNESMVFLFGLSYQGLGFGYSYDLTVSTQSYRTGGAHELNLTYVFNVKRKKGPQKSLPCPDFEYDILEKAAH